MKRLVGFVIFYVFVGFVTSNYPKCDNITIDAASRHLVDFKRRHPIPIGLLTTSAGEPVEVRDTITLNSDLFSNQYHLDLLTHADAERIPERLVHAKGYGAYGYFEVTHDVSKYTSADVFNDIGKKTPLVARFSTSAQNLGGTDLLRDLKGLAVKFYTKEGNLDMLCLQLPVYVYTDALDFVSFIHAFRRNPKTNLFDLTMLWDLITLKPISLHAFMWLQSDYGLPNGYRTMDVFPIHTYEISNKYGERHYVRFNFRTEQGLDNLTTTEAMAIGDLDHFSRDLYNSIAEKNYPTWRLEMDVMSLDDIKNIDYNPFDVTRLWRRGTYNTVQIGRLVINQHVDNNFKDVEQGAFNPANLVPGIPGPVDSMFKARRVFYRDTQNYRLGINHNKIDVNTPKYAKTYNRDGVAPLRQNMKDAPNYYPNSYNGPVPYVDESRPKEKLLVLQSTAVDLEPASYFYNHVVESDAHKQRVATYLAETLQSVADPNVIKRALKLLTMVDPRLGDGVEVSLRALRAAGKRQPNDRYKRIAQCLEMAVNKIHGD